MFFANSDLLFEDTELLADGSSLARPESIQVRPTNETKRPSVDVVSQDRKTTLQSKESTCGKPKFDWSEHEDKLQFYLSPNSFRAVSATAAQKWLQPPQGRHDEEV
jgi:hypothetical protein